MPIYEFLCQKCGKGFVFSSSISEYERKRTEASSVRRWQLGGRAADVEFSGQDHQEELRSDESPASMHIW